MDEGSSIGSIQRHKSRPQRSEPNHGVRPSERRNTAGSYVGMSPFVGVLMGPGADADFVLVGIGSSNQERAEVTSLCRASGIYGVE
jgi:hypothetical protein